MQYQFSLENIHILKKTNELLFSHRLKINII